MSTPPGTHGPAPAGAPRSNGFPAAAPTPRGPRLRPHTRRPGHAVRRRWDSGTRPAAPTPTHLPALLWGPLPAPPRARPELPLGPHRRLLSPRLPILTARSPSAAVSKQLPGRAHPATEQGRPRSQAAKREAAPLSEARPGWAALAAGRSRRAALGRGAATSNPAPPLLSPPVPSPAAGGGATEEAEPTGRAMETYEEERAGVFSRARR